MEKPGESRILSIVPGGNPDSTCLVGGEYPRSNGFHPAQPMLFARGLAFVQFITAAIGVATLHVMVKLDDPGRHPDVIASLAPWLARHGLWLFAIPILWAVFANAVRDKLPEKVLNAFGVAITVFLFLLLAVPLAFYLR